MSGCATSWWSGTAWLAKMRPGVRPVALAGLLLMRLVAAEAPSPAAWAPPEDIMPRLEATLSDLVAHGFPDTRTGTLVTATLAVSGIHPERLARCEWLIDLGNAPCDAAGTMSYAGLHLRLADGGWFAGCALPFLAGDPLSLAAKEVVPWQPATAAVRPVTFVEFQEFMECIDPGMWHWTNEHPEVDRFSQAIQVPSASTLLVLVGQHIAGAPRAIVRLAIEQEIERRVRSAQGLQAGQARLRLFADRMLDGQNDGLTERKRVLATGPRVTWQDLRPEAVLQAEALRWWERRVLHGLGGAPALAEIQRLSASLSAAVQVLADDDLARLPLAVALAGTQPGPPAEQGLAERLIAWVPPPPPPRKHGKPVATPPSPDRFTTADLPALARLIADGHPSRWISRELSEGGIPVARTVGDNALRAMADVLHLDPRWLTTVSPAQAWNDAARRQVAGELVVLLPEQAPVDAGALMARAMSRLPLRDASYVLSGLPAVQRGPLLAALADASHAMPDSRLMPEHDDLAALLALAGPDPGMRAAVAGWGERAGNLPATALYLANQGDERLLDVVAAQVDPGRPMTHDDDDTFKVGGSYYLRETMVALGAHPSAARLASVIAACRGDWRRELALLEDRGDQWYGEIKGMAGASERSWRAVPGFVATPVAWPAPPVTGVGAEVIPLAVLVRLLHDRTAIPPAEIAADGISCSLARSEVYIPLVSGAEEGIWSGHPSTITGPAAGDLRVCDVAAAVLARYGVDWLENGGGDRPVIDLRQPMEQREQVLVEWRCTTIERAHQAFIAAHLPLAGLPVVPRKPSGNDF